MTETETLLDTQTLNDTVGTSKFGVDIATQARDSRFMIII